MRPIRRVSILDQTAEHLREGIRTGRWRGELPGVLRLAAECDVSKGAMRGALRLLEKEGLLSAGRAGGRRTVLAGREGAPATGTRAKARTLRIAILLNDPLEKESSPMHHILRDIQRGLEAAGHAVAFAPKPQVALRFDPARIARMVAATPADVWIVVGAPLPVIEFFAAQPLPVIAIGGRGLNAGVAFAGTDGIPAVCTAARRLLSASALGRSAPARDDRHGAGLQAGAAAGR